MKLIDGKETSKYLRSNLEKEIKKFKTRPKMIDIQIGYNMASDIYIAGKAKASEAIGIDFECIRFEDGTKQEKIISKIHELNNDASVNGIFIQSPIPKSYDEIKIMNEVNPKKDIDGLTYINAGRLLNNKKALVSCTPNGIIELLKYYKIKIKGKNVCIIGRSNLVGKPLFNLFLNNDATVTLCHSHTKDLEKITKKADILVVAIGVKHFVTAKHVKKNAVVIDVGINREDKKIYGDVNFDEVAPKTKFITPVPGGVGPMTITMLLKNVVDAYKDQNNIL